MNKNFIKALVLEPVHPALYDVFSNHPKYHVVDGSRFSDIELKHELKNTNIIVVRSKKINRLIIDAAPHLRVIGRAGSGMENIDTKYAKSKNIVCINSPEGNRDAVGEHLIGMLLMLLNKIHIADSEVRKNVWDRKSNWGYELKGQCFGIIGYGNMGSAVAQKLKGFECDILVYDKYKTIVPSNNMKPVSLETIYENADIISLHLPLNEETIYYANEEFFNQFKKNIYFINTARGKLLKTSSLVNALKSGKVKGACLDVLEYESDSFENMSEQQNDDFDYLKKSPAVVLTPHIAGWTHQSYEKICRILAEKIVHFFESV